MLPETCQTCDERKKVRIYNHNRRGLEVVLVDLYRLLHMNVLLFVIH